MAAVREWFKTIGGPVGLIASGVGFAFMLLPLGVGLIVIGALLWLYRWERFPFRISRRNRGEADAERRALLGLARAVSIELETCRRRRVVAEWGHVGWLCGHKVPAGTSKTAWAA